MGDKNEVQVLKKIREEYYFSLCLWHISLTFDLKLPELTDVYFGISERCNNFTR